MMNQLTGLPNQHPADPLEAEHELQQALIARLLRYGWVLKRRWWVVFLCGITAGVAGVSWVVRQPVQYVAGTQIVYDPRRPNILNGVHEIFDVREMIYNQDLFVQTQIRRLVSRETAEEVARRLRLPVEQVTGAVNAEPDAKALVLHLTATAPDSARAAALVNAVAALSVEQTIEEKRGVKREARDFLEREAKRLRAELETAERALYGFQLKSRLPGATFEDSQKLLAGSLGALTGRVSEVRAKRIKLESQVKELDDILAASELPATIPVDEAAEEWKQRYQAHVTNQRELKELRSRYGEQHPKLRAAVSRAFTDQELRSFLRELRSGLHSRARALTSEENRTSREVQTENARAMALRRLDVEFNRLTRENCLANPNWN
jgi:uncharacterized protein involved in exopolysaccharide biosynthesis